MAILPNILFDGFITVPLNDEGMEDYDYGRQDTPNLKEWYIDEDTCKFLMNRLFNFYNVECNILIDYYESDEIKGIENLTKAKEITEILIRNTDPDDTKFISLAKKCLDMINLAIEKDTLVGFDF